MAKVWLPIATLLEGSTIIGTLPNVVVKGAAAAGIWVTCEAVTNGELMIEAMIFPRPTDVGVPVLTRDAPVGAMLVIEAKTFGEEAT